MQTVRYNYLSMFSYCRRGFVAWHGLEYIVACSAGIDDRYYAVI